MARTTLTVQEIESPFDVPAAGVADFTWTAGDVANGNDFACTGRELILVQNTDGATPYYVTISSVVDEKGRTEDIDEYSLAAGDFARFSVGLTNSKGWQQSDGKINIDVENAAVEIAVLRLPAGVGR